MKWQAFTRRRNPDVYSDVNSKGWMLPDGRMEWFSPNKEHRNKAKELGYKSITDEFKKGAVRVAVIPEDNVVTLELQAGNKKALDTLKVFEENYGIYDTWMIDLTEKWDRDGYPVGGWYGTAYSGRDAIRGVEKKGKSEGWERVENPADNLKDKIKDATRDIAIAAQIVYDEWDQDDEGIDEVYGGGGICDSICEIIHQELGARGIETIDGGQDGDDHAYVIAYDDKDAYVVDIPYGVYESGGGYNWKKKSNIKFKPSDVSIDKIDRKWIEQNSGKRKRRMKRKNPVVESMLGGMAAGAAAGLMGAYMGARMANKKKCNPGDMAEYTVAWIDENGRKKVKGGHTWAEAKGFANKLNASGNTGFIGIWKFSDFIGKKDPIEVVKNPGRKKGEYHIEIGMRRNAPPVETKQYEYDVKGRANATKKIMGFIQNVGHLWDAYVMVMDHEGQTVFEGAYNGDNGKWTVHSDDRFGVKNRPASVRNPRNWKYTITSGGNRLDYHGGANTLKEARSIAYGLMIKNKKTGIVYVVRDADGDIKAEFNTQSNPGNHGKRTAEAMSESFHGRPVRDWFEFTEEFEDDDEFAILGILTEIEIRTEDGKNAIPIEFTKSGKKRVDPKRDVLVCTNPEGTQLYFIGGDQNLEDAIEELKRNGCLVEDRVKKVNFGLIYSVSYFADKHHLEGPESQKDGCHYIHKLGEESGIEPQLIWDKKSGLMDVVGGDYEVRDVGIWN